MDGDTAETFDEIKKRMFKPSVLHLSDNKARFQLFVTLLKYLLVWLFINIKEKTKIIDFLVNKWLKLQQMFPGQYLRYVG